MASPADTIEWVLGGKNIDEDPLFSQYYLADSAKVYGAARAFYQGCVEAYYIPADKAALVARRYTNKALKNPDWLYQNIAKTQTLLQQIEHFLDGYPLSELRLRSMGMGAVAKIYARQRRLTEQLYKLSRIPQALDRGSDCFTEHMLSQLRRYSSDDVYRHFALLTTPENISRFEQAELKENEIANRFIGHGETMTVKVRMRASAEDIARVDALTQEFGHIAYHGYGNRKLLTADDFWNRIQAKVNSGGGLLPTLEDAAIKLANLAKEKQQLVRSLSIDPALQTRLNLYGAIALAKIDRRFVQIKNFVLLDAIIGRIAQEYDIPEIAIRFMTQSELNELFASPDRAALLASQAMKRTDVCVWMYDATGLHIRTGQSIYDDLLNATAGPVRPKLQLTGTPVCAGGGDSIKARARIVYRAEDIFTKGDILVSEATDPDLVAHMRSAVAILTEQGGVTSHASILARELNTPCIVGVKDLLSSVKDGDLLLVDTKRGSIKNLGQTEESVIGLDRVASCSLDDFGGKALGLHKLKSIGYGDYLPGTYFVKSTFSGQNEADAQNLKRVVSALAPAKLAIRSSSVLEDDALRSWAGQFPTFLHVEPNVTAVHSKLERLLGWKPKASYTDGSSVADGSMRAIIQEQVDAVISGVCFTKCPVTNDESKIIIEFVNGLGDALVSGRAIPQRLVYSKTKAEFLETQSFASQGLNQAFITLVQISLHAEKSWETPVDIEFAIDAADNLKLLQCRAITT